MSSSKTVLITGCSRGVGLGLAKEYFARGYQVIATCRNPDGANDLKTFLEKNGQKPPIQLDVASQTSIEDCKAKICSDITVLDVLVNNAGISNKDHPDDLASGTDLTEFNQIMHTNVTAVLSMTQAFLPVLLKSAEPRVINISSGLGSLKSSPRYSTTSYQCSKAALNMLTKCFADDVKAATFVAIHPGWVQTDMGSSKNRKPPVTVEDSAKGIIDVAHGITPENSGCFMGFDGAKMDY